ncbi:hypothetical protein TrVE_jg13294 [Triparma verrucosa]|uniref:Uncharacterized protein n=1 Tax=Triparma verrucosa TaxID=1606542 RepID=A0A9W7F3C3_9STRA|nr:hypothetical protein TrVE_jg13294 [Triparma verrucosa]
MIHPEQQAEIHALDIVPEGRSGCTRHFPRSSTTTKLMICFVLTCLFWSSVFPSFEHPASTPFRIICVSMGTVLPTISWGLFLYPKRLKFAPLRAAAVRERGDKEAFRGPIIFGIVSTAIVTMSVTTNYNLYPPLTSPNYSPRQNRYMESVLRWAIRSFMMFVVPFTAWYAYGHSCKKDARPITYAGKYYIPIFLLLNFFTTLCIGVLYDYSNEIIFVQILLGPLLGLVIIQDKTCDPSKEFRLNEQGKTRYIENDGRYFGLLLCLFATYAVTMGAILGRVSAAALLAGFGPHRSLIIRSTTLQICSSITIGAAEVVAKRSSTMEKFGVLMMPIYIATNAFQLSFFLDIHIRFREFPGWKLFLKLIGVSVAASIFKNSGGNEVLAWILRFRDYPFACSKTFRSLQTKLTVDSFSEVVAFFLVASMFLLEHHWIRYFGDNVRIANIGEDGLPHEPLRVDYDMSHCAFSCVGFRLEETEPPRGEWKRINFKMLILFLVASARTIMLSLERMLVIDWRLNRYRTSVISGDIDIEENSVDDSIIDALSTQPTESTEERAERGVRGRGGMSSMGSAIVSGIDFMDKYQYNPSIYGSFVVRKAEEARRYVENMNSNLSNGWDPDMNKWEGVPITEFVCSRSHGWVRKHPVARIWQVMEKTDHVRANPAQLAALLSSTNNCLPSNANDQTFVEQLHPGVRTLYQYYGASFGLTDRDALWTEVLYRFDDGAVIVAFFSCEHPARPPLPGVRRITIPPCGIMLYPEEDGTTTVVQGWGVDLKSSFITNTLFRKSIVNYLKRCSHAHICECIEIKNKGEELLDNFRHPASQAIPINTSNIVSMLSDLEQPSLRNQPFRPFVPKPKESNPYSNVPMFADSPTNSSAWGEVPSNFGSENTDEVTISNPTQHSRGFVVDSTPPFEVTIATFGNWPVHLIFAIIWTVANTLSFGLWAAAFLKPHGDHGLFCIEGDDCTFSIPLSDTRD